MATSCSPPFGNLRWLDIDREHAPLEDNPIDDSHLLRVYDCLVGARLVQPGEVLAQFVEDRCRSSGSGLTNSIGPTVRRMREHQSCRMQKRSLEVRHGAQVARDAAMDAAVQRVADDRMADGAEVDANLMRASGVNRDAGQGQHPAEMLRADDARDRFALRGARAPNLFPMFGVAADRRVDAASGHDLAPDQRDVLFLDLAIVKLPGRARRARRRAWRPPSARRPAIEPVHDPRPLLAADAAEVVDVMEERVHQRPVAWPAAGCTTMPAGLSTTIRSRSW